MVRLGRAVTASSLALGAVSACTDDPLPTDVDPPAPQAVFNVTADTIGTGVGSSEVTLGSIIPIISETGMITLSVDGTGTNAPSSTVQVDKPAGATVRGAYLAAASTGFSSRRLNNGEVQINGTGVTWSITTPSSIVSWNHWADVTAIVKPVVDAAPAGRVNFTITESTTFGIDGEILAVILDDPNVTTENTVVLLFGAQNIFGDDFYVNLADPLDKSDPLLQLDMGLGISYGFQPSGQVSYVDVNGSRLTSCAGGQDDGVSSNGGLVTVGGLDDSQSNPVPNCSGTAAGSPRQDDELYSLVPFADDGDTEIAVHTVNPSRDDNIFFASFFLTVDATVTPEPDPNNRPVAAAGGPYTANEGSPILFDGSGSFDADDDPITYSWNFGDGGSGSDVAPTHTYLDNGDFTVVLTVEDPEPSSDTDETIARIYNVAPDLSGLSYPLVPTPVGAAVTVGGVFTDPGVLDTHVVTFDWGDGVSGPGSVAETHGSGSVSGTHTYASAGVYVVSVTVTDKDGDSDSMTIEYIVVYDPDGGFVTGGGWIDSPAGSYPAAPQLGGKATLGFVSKYLKGATVPSGNTQFQFHAAGLTFHSTLYEWLVVAGARAQYKGEGTIDGTPGYGFMLTAIDGQQNGGGGVDRFRLKIWRISDSVVVYDNNLGAADNTDPSTVLGGGSIVIHTKK